MWLPDQAVPCGLHGISYVLQKKQVVEVGEVEEGGGGQHYCPASGEQASRLGQLQG